MKSAAPHPSQLPQALKAFARIVGGRQVFHTPEDRRAYADPFSADETRHLPAAAIAPASVQEIQAIVRTANEHRVPLWPISRGKNFGYGGPAPILSGSVMLDLSRMKQFEIDSENATALLEPGVGFFDLYDHLQARKIPLWLSVPGNSWGSIAGNALDRGVGYTPYGDHAARICGLEAVLPNGDLVRTGMGAMANSPNWRLYKPGFGPAWDQMFVQSNFGIVTKLGLWLMPEPESMLGLDLEFDKPDDIEWAVDILARLRREGVIQQSPSIGNWLRAAAILTTRRQWTDAPGPLNDAVVNAIRKRFNIGWWSASIRFYGPYEMTRAAKRITQHAFNGRTLLSMKKTRWLKGDPPDRTPYSGAPITFPLANMNWHGGRGGHVGYSPVLPANGALALKQFQRTYQLYNEFGLDYHASFAMGERHLTNVNQILFDKDNPAMVRKTDSLFRALVAGAAAERYGEYRTHIDYMDLVAETYDFNHHALRRLNECVKDALDPNGILAPGKSGIWPKAYRGPRA